MSSIETLFERLLKKILEDLLSQEKIVGENEIKKILNAPSGYLSIKQASHYLSCSTKTIRRHISEGKLPAKKISNKLYRVKKSDLDQLGTSKPAVDIQKIASQITANLLKGQKRR